MRFINTGKAAGYLNLEHVAQFSGALEGGTCWIVVAGVQGVTHMQGECCQQIQDAIEATMEPQTKGTRRSVYAGRINGGYAELVIGMDDEDGDD